MPSDDMEYVLINRTELWEVNYSTRSAVEVSEVVQKELLKKRPIDYDGSIVDYLSKKKNCKNIHFHNSLAGADRPHSSSCTFDV